jgi:hypothetical protein
MIHPDKFSCCIEMCDSEKHDFALMFIHCAAKMMALVPSFLHCLHEVLKISVTERSFVLFMSVGILHFWNHSTDFGEIIVFKESSQNAVGQSTGHHV